jgi:hypothetical protein
VTKLRVLAIALACAVVGSASSSRAAAPQAAAADPVTVGTIKVWMPAGMVGADYWIYVDGHVVGGPPHEAVPRDTVVVKTSDGWQAWGPNGVVLATHHENWDGRLVSYIHSDPPDPQHIFQATALLFPPGIYSVQGMLLSQHNSTFPFIVTKTYSVEVKTDRATQLYIAVPDGWSKGPAPLPARAIRAFCPSSSQLPDFDELQRWASDYMAEPMVQLLEEASSGVRTPGQHVVTLALPAEQGGPREFDGAALAALVDAVTLNNAFPQQDEIARCAAKYPGYAGPYASYGRAIAAIDKDEASFRKLAKDLQNTP